MVWAILPLRPVEYQELRGGWPISLQSPSWTGIGFIADYACGGIHVAPIDYGSPGCWSLERHGEHCAEDAVSRISKHTKQLVVRGISGLTWVHTYFHPCPSCQSLYCTRPLVLPLAATNAVAIYNLRTAWIPHRLGTRDLSRPTPTLHLHLCTAASPYCVL